MFSFCRRKDQRSIGEGFDMDSQSPKQSDTEEPKKPDKQTKGKKSTASKPAPAAARRTARRVKEQVNYEEEEEEEDEEYEEEETEEEEKEPPAKVKKTVRSKSPPAKAGTKQTKLDDFSISKGKGAGKASGKAEVNGASNKTGLKTSAQTSKSWASSTSVLKVVTPPAPSRPRKRGTESENSALSSPDGKTDDRPSPAVVKRLKPPTLREDL